ncbi:hypothetical protein [Bacillus sp. NPDC077027]|uniref:hypothetical protein n=1 Tax=Bacillus sp. NPDC077027 TaxID=3390548 RepID=UPI003D082A90
MGGERKALIRQCFGGHLEFIEALGIKDDYIAGKYRKGTGNVQQIVKEVAVWTKERLITKVQQEYQQGNAVNYSHIENHWGKRFIPVINKLFGSHQAFIFEAGIDYSAIRGNHTLNPDIERNKVKSVITSEIGYRFEELLGQFLQELGREFSKYDSGYADSKPDFIFSPDHWGDAKLSVNADTTRMRRKYLQHCKKVTVFHLIGHHDYSATLQDGTERTSVFAFLKKQDRNFQDKFLPLFLEMEQEYYQAVA